MDYKPQVIDTEDIELGDELDLLIEEMAKNVHENWAELRLAQCWKYGTERNDEAKLHPCLVNYEDLPELEKEYDRNTAIKTLKFIKKLGFEIVKRK